MSSMETSESSSTAKSDDRLASALAALESKVTSRDVVNNNVQNKKDQPP